MKNIYFIPIVIVLAGIAVYGLSTVKKPDQNAQSSASEPANSSSGMAKKDSDKNQDMIIEEDHGSKLAGSKIDLQNVNSLKPGNVTLAFKLYGADTNALVPKDLKVNNEKLVHLYVVRSDMTGYQHLYPEYMDGRWTVSTQIPQPGNYNLYVSIMPVREKETTLRFPIVIGEKTMEKNYPDVSKDLSKTVDGFTAMIEGVSQIKKTKEEVDMNFKITENNNAVSQIDSYLGNFGNAIVFSHTDSDHFENASSMTQTKPADGTVKFKAKFPMDGMYTIFSQFNINGQIKTFPITIEVGDKKDKPKDDHM